MMSIDGISVKTIDTLTRNIHYAPCTSIYTIMKPEHYQIEATFSGKHRFGWTPSYEDDFSTQLNQTLAIEIAAQAASELDWDILYRDETSLEVKRPDFFRPDAKKISLRFQNQRLYLKSESIGGGLWDIGQNSKTVMLFVHIFRQIEAKHDGQSLKE